MPNLKFIWNFSSLKLMINILVPTFRTLHEKRDPFKKYTAFDIYVNGNYHASVRYSILYNLHEKLVEVFGFRLDVPEFPPKKLWRIFDNKAINGRREALGKYFQGVVQNPDIGRHIILENAFLEYQISTFDFSSFVKLNIYFADGQAIVVDCHSNDSTNVVMKKFCEVAKINLKNVDAFGLFLCRARETNDSNNFFFDKLCVNWLKNFEAPYISLNLAKKESGLEYNILVRRVTWDPLIEEPLLNDEGFLKLLFLQALNDLERGIMIVTPEIKDCLMKYKDENDLIQFMRLCHQQPTYGYEVLAPVISDFPSQNIVCQLKVGRRQLVLEYDDFGVKMQTILRSTRIRVWRVSQTNSQQTNSSSTMTFQIEYLVGKDEFGVITLETSQAIILSLFLQSIATEILQNQSILNSPIYKFDDTISTKAIESLEVSKTNSIIDDNLNIKGYQSNGSEGNNYDGNINETLFKIISYQMPFDNDSFEEITDEDL